MQKTRKAYQLRTFLVEDFGQVMIWPDFYPTDRGVAYLFEINPYVGIVSVWLESEKKFVPFVCGDEQILNAKEFDVVCQAMIDLEDAVFVQKTCDRMVDILNALIYFPPTK